MIVKSLVTTLILALSVLVSGFALAEVKPHPLFSDGAVLQQGMSVPVWGTANDGEKVTVSFRGQTVSTTAKNGKWMVRLKPSKAGGPFTMTISGKNRIELKDVLVGEVWVASGQSNMWMTVGAVANAKEVIAASADPTLRLFMMPEAAAFARKGISIQQTGTLDVENTWRESRPENIARFSAVGYLFGRDLRKALKVPVGIIKASIGSSYVHEWIRRDIVESSPDLRICVDELTGGLYGDMIAPVMPYAIKGVIWYQGENDAAAQKARPTLYRIAFTTMIRNWRDNWGQGDFPFLFVQLAPYFRHQPDAKDTPNIPTEPGESSWAVVRESQLLTSLNVPKTAMAVITDYGDPNDIHPHEKEPVGQRLALAARAIVYGEKVTYSGPVYKSIKIKGDRATISFRQAGSGLVSKGGELAGFTIAGEDRKFVNAKAKIQGDQVVVWSPEVLNPVAVRYGWADYPIVNLFNKEGLPASPFRTDDFPLLSEPK
ncbi:MAG: sialate O-acetylesterase [Armatimonadetes bacterium]|nr:sialate O-acetylesterase [Armatimonadota bacterium]